ncbi:MAG: TolC family protein [Planctomycetaceae bacterium]
MMSPSLQSAKFNCKRKPWYLFGIGLGRSLLVGAILPITMTVSGCTRSFWREQADADVYQAIGQKLNDPRWAVPRLDVTPDQRSRFFDPYDLDHAPLPPDDAAAHSLMHCVDGKQGYGGWHKFGDLLNVENPAWLGNFGITADMIDPATGAYTAPVPALEEVTLAEAVELSLIHSREYQTQLESVYLAALDVTFQRFQFGVRYLGIGGGEPSSNATYALRPNGRPDPLTFNNRFGVSQLLPAGGQIAFELANSTIWLFGSDSTSSASSLSYSLVQPLLLGAGRKIVLETLTQTERNLLYTLRDLARFRQQFFTDVVGSNGGYLGLLQTVQSIRNQEDNIVRFESQLIELQAANTRPGIPRGAPLEKFPAGVTIPEGLQTQLRFNPLDGHLSWLGPMSDEQEQQLRSLSDDPAYREAINDVIEQVRADAATLDELQLQSQLATNRNRLRELRRQLQDALDSYKIRLGLPTDIPISIDEGLLAQFQLIDPTLRELETNVERFVLEFGRIDDEDPELNQLLSTLTRYVPLAEGVRRASMGILDQDAARVAANMEKRLSQLTESGDRDRVQAEIVGDQRRLATQKSDFDRNIQRAGHLRDVLASMQQLDQENRQQLYTETKRLQEDLLEAVRSLTVTQIDLRLQLITVQPFDMPPEQVVAMAIENRVDLMNDRALVMDARRQMEVAANRLMSRIDLVAQGDVRNTGGSNPADFRLDRSEFRFGLQFTAPLDQIQERNAYRASQIAYQRSRRAYMLAEDQVKQQVRQSWRQLDVLKGNLETSRMAVRIAARQLDAAIQDANDPSKANTNSGGLRGQQLLNALNNVLSALNGLLGNWVSYEQNRLNIYRDMGIMEVGPDGLWTDSFYQNAPDEADFPTTPADPLQTRFLPQPSNIGDRGWPAGAGDRDGVVLVGYRPDLDGSGRQSRLVTPAADDGDEGAISGQHLSAGARRQPQERDLGQQSGRIVDDYQYRSGGDMGESRGGRVRTGLGESGR